MNRFALIPRFNWDYGLKDIFTAFSFLISRGSEQVDPWEKIFGLSPLYTTLGRTSLYTILRSLEIPYGSGIGIPLYCCSVVFDAIVHAGYKPVFIDVESMDCNVSPSDVKKKRDSISALVVVHMFGQPADMDALNEACFGIPVIEDCAQALFSRYKGEWAGFRSTASFFSFRSGKYISTGEGSVIFCRDPSLRRRMNLLVSGYESWRWDQQAVHSVATYMKSSFYHRPWYGIFGFPVGMLLDKKFNLTAKSGLPLKKIAPVDLRIINGKVGVFLEKIEKQKHYWKYLKDRLQLERIILPRDLEGRESNGYMYTVRLPGKKERDFVSDFLFRNGIDCAKYLDEIGDLARNEYGYLGDCPTAEQCSKTILSIPVYYTMSYRDLDRIAHALTQADYHLRSGDVDP